MSIALPKRIKDLAPLEPDSEDESKTPGKLIDKFDRKDNVFVKSRNSLFQPKRLSELTGIEEDLDYDLDADDDKTKTCAALNESFLLSPSNTIDNFEIDSGISSQICSKEQDVETNMRNCINMADENIDVTKLKINDIENIIEMPSKRSPKPLDFGEAKIEKPTLAIKPLGEIELNYAHESKIHNSNQIQTQTLKCISNNDPIINRKIVFLSKAKSEELHTRESDIENKSNRYFARTPCDSNIHTPFKINGYDFITPKIKSFQMPTSRRLRDLNSISSVKTRNNIENEFRFQKVLFTTPIAVSRPPVLSLPNDSITLSICDTPDQKKNEEIKKAEVRNSKKSLKNIFSSNENNEKQSSEQNFVFINNKRFIIKNKIGSGGSSSVFLANEDQTNKEWAVKIVDLRGEKSIIEGYLNEAKLLDNLQGNVNVVKLYQYEHLVDESKLYMVMEKGDSDLHKILQSYTNNIPLYTLISFWYQMLQAVHYIHQNGIIHSDLKPANFLMVNGRLKLIDFGIASNIAVDSTSIIKYSQAGTFNYISPEALIDTSTGYSPISKGQPKIKISKKSDVWSLGCILYLLLYKKTPFSHIKNMHAKVAAITNPNVKINYPELPNYYPPMLIEMVEKCLRHNPKQRLSVMDLLKYPFDMVISLENMK